MTLLLLAVAWAGAIRVTTDRKADVRLKNVPILTTFGSLDAEIEGFEPGRYLLSVTVDGKTEQIDVVVREEGGPQLVVSTSVRIEPKPTPLPPESPALTLQSTDGKGYTLIVDGKRTAVIGGRYGVTFPTLGEGQHAIEVRSAKQDVIWLRGTLQLENSDAITFGLREGHPMTLQGRTEAWKP